MRLMAVYTARTDHEEQHPGRGISDSIFQGVIEECIYRRPYTEAECRETQGGCVRASYI